MKEKSLFEQKEIGYTDCNGVYIPNLVLPRQYDYQIGRFGLMHKKVVKGKSQKHLHCTNNKGRT